MKKKYYPRFRKETPNPKIYLRLHRSEFGDYLRAKKIDQNSFYPDSTKLIKKICNFHRVKKENVLIGLGAESLIKDIFIWFSKLKKYKNILNIVPNYFMYSLFSEVFNCKEYKLKHDPIKKNINSDMIIKVLKKKNINLLVLVNPSSPFEINWEKNELIKIMNFCKYNKIIVVLDEVYQLMGSNSFINNIKRYDNLIILRSLSKGFGYPGIRSGYIIANSNLVKDIETFRLAIELPFDTLNKSIKAISNFKKNTSKRVNQIVVARNFAHKQFQIRGIKSFNFFSNSVSFLFDSEVIKNKVCKKLNKKKILLNYNYDGNLKCFANITTTNKKNLEFFFKSLDESMKIK